MLTEQRIFTDLSACDLMKWDQACLYLLAEQVEQAKFTHNQTGSVQQLSTPFLVDGRLWEAEIQNATLLLRPEAGAPLTLPTKQFEHLLELGHITQADLATSRARLDQHDHGYVQPCPANHTEGRREQTS
jgi:hypothetical protein